MSTFMTFQTPARTGTAPESGYHLTAFVLGAYRDARSPSSPGDAHSYLQLLAGSEHPEGLFSKDPHLGSR